MVALIALFGGLLLICVILKVLGAIARGLLFNKREMPEAREVNRGDIEEVLLRLDEIQDAIEELESRRVRHV